MSVKRQLYQCPSAIMVSKSRLLTSDMKKPKAIILMLMKTQIRAGVHVH